MRYSNLEVLKMALKIKLTKEQYEALSDALKAEYVADGEGYRLDADFEDTGALKRAKDREAQLRRDAEQKLKEATDALDALSGDDAKKKGDIVTLEKSWQGKLDKLTNESEAKIKTLTGHVTKNLVDKVATEIATKISKAPSILSRFIKDRLAVDFEGDEPKTRVLDKEGKPSALTLDELANEFVANKDFADIIIGSKASGSAKPSNQNPPSGANSDKTADLSKMSPMELANHLKESKANQS